MGCKGKFEQWLTPEGLIKIEGWAKDGLTNEQIAHNMGIANQTIYDWINRFPELSDALKKGKVVVDRMVENALLKSALGYKFEEVTYERRSLVKNDGSVGDAMVETKRVVKEVPPNQTAQIFWLKNRDPKKWRDKVETEVNGDIKIEVSWGEDK